MPRLLRILDAERYTSSSICALREPCAPVLVPADAYVVAHGFHDDDRTIDDKPEVYRTELIRFPLTPKSFIIPKANNMDNGITVATTSPAR